MSKKARIAEIVRFVRTLGRAFPGSFLDTLIVCGRSICFSNFGEDLLLTRMFTLPEVGFYVDVGANHPIRASNTFRLDLMGWSGLAIEPNPDLARKFPRLRPACAVVNCGVGTTEGEMEYIRFDRDQCNTFDEVLADSSKRRGAREIGRHPVDIRPLSRLLEKHVGSRHIDVMSIDIEGFDLQALTSNDWSRWRPSIILIEDHLPLGASFETSEIANYLRDKSYTIVARVHFTSFFVRSDHMEKLAW
jgi:FkbM family methyltransferase